MKPPDLRAPSTRRLSLLIEEQQAASTVDVIHLVTAHMSHMSPHVPTHLGHTGPSVQVHCPVSTLSPPAALDVTRLAECFINIVRRLSRLARGKHNLRSDEKTQSINIQRKVQPHTKKRRYNRNPGTFKYLA